MAHKIEQALNGLFMMAWAKENSASPPWHLSDTNAPSLDAFQARNVVQARAVAGCDFSVSKAPLYLSSGSVVPGYAAIVRSDGKALGVRSEDRYTLVQPTVFDVAAQSAIDRSEGRVYVDTCMSLEDGHVFAMTLALGSTDAAPGDAISWYWLYSTSFDGTLANTVGLVASRTVCNNTLRLNLSSASSKLFRFRHTKSADAKCDAINDALPMMAGEIGLAQAKIDRLVSSTWTKDQMVTAIGKLFPSVKARAAKGSVASKANASSVIVPAAGFDGAAGASILDAILTEGERATWTAGDVLDASEDASRKAKAIIMDLYEGGTGAAPGTAWGALNAITEYTTHKQGRSDAGRVYNTLVGPQSGQGEAAMDLILSMVSVQA